MNGLMFISCIRFSLQLMFAESTFLIPFPKRKFFMGKVVAALGTYFVLLYGIYYGLVHISINEIVSQILFYVLAFFMSMIIMAVVFEVSKEQILFAGIGGYTVQHMAYCLVRITQYFVELDNADFLQNMWKYAIPYLLLPTILYFLKIRKYYEEGEFKKKDVRMTVLAFFAMFVVIVLSMVTRSRLAGVSNDFLQLLICNLYGFLSCALILTSLFYIPKENKLYHDQQMLEQIIRVMGEQQQLSKESVEIINRKCHDIKHQLNAIIGVENQEERKKYIKEIRNAISIYDAIYQTGNAPLDAILREKGFMCQEYQIKFSCMADGEALYFMDTLDIYALFGNAIDNAIESVMKEEDEEKRIISMQITRKGQMVYIHLDNYCKDEVQFEDGLPITNKNDKNYHGFGVKSIQHIAEKYDGELVLRQQKERFLLDILLPLPTENIQN